MALRLRTLLACWYHCGRQFQHVNVKRSSSSLPLMSGELHFDARRCSKLGLAILECMQWTSAVLCFHVPVGVCYMLLTCASHLLCCGLLHLQQHNNDVEL